MHLLINRLVSNWFRITKLNHQIRNRKEQLGIRTLPLVEHAMLFGDT